MVQHTIHLIMYSLNQIREVALVLGIGVNKVRQLLRVEASNITGPKPAAEMGADMQEEDRNLKRSASCMSEEAAPAKRTRAAEALDPDTDTAAESHETVEMQRARARQSANKIAAEHGGHCKGVSRASQGQGLVGCWTCKFGHSFELLLSQAKAGEWCQPCHRWNQLLTEGQTLAAAMQGMLLTRDMSNYGVDRGFLTWACSSQHRFDLAIADVRRGHWCPHCRMQRDLTKSAAEQAAAAAKQQQQQQQQHQQQQQRQWQQQQWQQQQRLFAEAKARQAPAPKPTNQRGLGRGGARAQPVRQPQLVMPATVPADAKYTLEQAQLVFKVLMQPAAAMHTFRTIAGILPSDIPKDVQRKLRLTLAKLHPDRNLAPNAIQAFQRLSQARDQLLHSLGL